MIVNDLKSHVLCSKCEKFGYRSGPYQCKRGHMICPNCQPVTKVCPQCKVDLDVNDPIWCHSAVDFLRDKVPVPCIYKINGCTEKDERAKIRQHVSECAFREQSNVVDLIEGFGTAEAGAIVGGAESRGGDDGADNVVVADINDQNEETVGGAAGDGSEDDAETALVEDINVQNEEIVGGAGGGRGGEDDTEEAANMDDRNVEKVGETEGPVLFKGDNDKVVLAEGDEIDIGMEVDREAWMGEEEDNNGAGIEEDDEWMSDEDLGFSPLAKRKGTRKRRQPQRYSPEAKVAFSPLAERKSTRKRRQPQRYSPEAKVAKATPTVEGKSEENCETLLPSHNTTLGTFYDEKPSEVLTESVLEDDPVESDPVIPDRFECTFCDEAFCCRRRVTEHLASYHAEPFTVSTTVVYRCCMFCDSRYLWKPDLCKHISDLHRDKFEFGGGN